jgi:hypothetical protein
MYKYILKRRGDALLFSHRWKMQAVLVPSSRSLHLRKEKDECPPDTGCLCRVVRTRGNRELLILPFRFRQVSFAVFFGKNRCGPFRVDET